MFREFFTLYCNPFYGECKELFCENSGFFESFFHRTKNGFQNLEKKSPKAEYSGPDPASRQCLPEDPPQGHGGGIAQADVRPANPEAQFQPAQEGRQQENSVGQEGVPGPQGPQQVVDEAQQPAQSQGSGGPQENGMGGHWNILRSQPPISRGSW